MCRRPLDWRESTAEEFASAIEGLCVEKDGKCACDPCKCQNQDVARDGEW